MKKLLLTALAFGLFSCSNSDETTENSNLQFGTFTFTYNGITTTIDGQNDPNNPQTFNVYNATLQTYDVSTQKVISLDGGYSNGAHIVTLLYNTSTNYKSVSYAKNGIIKVQKAGNGCDVIITDETADYVSGTFYAPDLTGTFTKIPKKK